MVQMCCDPSCDQFAKKEETYVSTVCVAEMLLATDHARNALRLAFVAEESLHLMHAHTGQEDGSLVDRLVTAINDAADDVAGDGLSGHGDKVVYLLPDDKAKCYLFLQRARCRFTHYQELCHDGRELA
jgi:hypothetical protein